MREEWGGRRGWSGLWEGGVGHPRMAIKQSKASWVCCSQWHLWVCCFLGGTCGLSVVRGLSSSHIHSYSLQPSPSLTLHSNLTP